MSLRDLATAVVRTPWDRDPGGVAAEWARNQILTRLPSRFSAAFQPRILSELYRGTSRYRGNWNLEILVEHPIDLVRSAGEDCVGPAAMLEDTTLQRISLTVRSWHERRDGLRWEIRAGSMADDHRILDWERAALTLDWRRE